MRCEIPHRCVRRKYRIRRHSPFRLRNCWEGRSVRASSLLRQLAKGGCAARRLSWVTPGFSQSRRCKTTASEFELGTRGSESHPRLHPFSLMAEAALHHVTLGGGGPHCAAQISLLHLSSLPDPVSPFHTCFRQLPNFHVSVSASSP